MTPEFISKARKMLIRDEAWREYLYDCGTGKAIVTVGKVTGGIGHNFSAHPLSDAVIELLFQEDLSRAVLEAQLVLGLGVYQWLSENRKLAIINLTFTMGGGGVKKFVRMVDAIKKQDFILAGKELRDSLWAFQVDKKKTPDGRDDRVFSLLVEDLYVY